MGLGCGHPQAVLRGEAPGRAVGAGGAALLSASR